MLWWELNITIFWCLPSFFSVKPADVSKQNAPVNTKITQIWQKSQNNHISAKQIFYCNLTTNKKCEKQLFVHDIVLTDLQRINHRKQQQCQA